VVLPEIAGVPAGSVSHDYYGVAHEDHAPAIPTTKAGTMRIGPGQRVIATDNLRFGLFTSVPQGMTGTIIEVGGFFTTKYYVQWDNGEHGEVASNLVAPIRR
jgi:hypothetical protein